MGMEKQHEESMPRNGGLAGSARQRLSPIDGQGERGAEHVKPQKSKNSRVLYGTGITMARARQPKKMRNDKGTANNPPGKSEGLGASRPVGLKSSPPATIEAVEELLYQALETEIGGVQVYETALRCAINENLIEEWKKYLDETRHHEEILRDVFDIWDLDTDTETPGRLIVRHNGEALVEAMKKALATMPQDDAQLVAAECVVLAETKDHMNWELIGEVCGSIPGKRGKALKEAHEEVKEEEDEHLYHTTGWTRELWLGFLGRPAVLPPPEEVKDVKTAIGAARAKQDRTSMSPRRQT